MRLSRWGLAATVLLAFILIPFWFFEEEIAGLTLNTINSPRAAWLTGIIMATLLASDVFLPIPSSVVSTGAGALVGVVGGTIASWIGMTLGCAIGWWIGRVAGRPGARRLVTDVELARAETGFGRYGPWVLVVCRAVPVLAEASVLLAGVVRIPFVRFILITGLSNLGISAVYATLGARTVSTSSLLVAFTASVLLPGVFMLAARQLRPGA